MAGRSKRTHRSGPESSTRPDPSPQVDNDNSKLLFAEIVALLFKGFLCYRPLPPMLGDGGESVDLFKLYLVVRENGGYHNVSASGSWGLVASGCGFDPGHGLALKLVYVKYLEALEKWMVKHCDFGSGSGSMGGAEVDLKEVLVKISAENGEGNLESNVCVEENGSVVDNEDSVVKSSVEGSVVKSSVVEGDGDEGSRKRKRDESDLGMVRWVCEVARDPCDPAIGWLPDRAKWKEYGDEVVWKKVLSVRDKMMLKRNLDVRALGSIWEIKQRMHPSMYEDGTERVRSSQRVISIKDSKRMRLLQFPVSSSLSSHCDEARVDGQTDSSAESAVSYWEKQRRKRTPVGPQFQADVPEWIEETYESDSKWLGTQIWPLNKRGRSRMLIERDPIGKGRQDDCSCQTRGSSDCIRFHISEKRKKDRIELGSAYYQWKFDSMGEQVARSWSREDEQKFEDIVKSNPLSEEKCFWNEIFTSFPKKNRESLVSYYFNVFLLRRRGVQNRTNTSGVDSDDDESEYGPRFNCFGRDAKFSIFCSPKKNTSGSEVVHES